MLSCSGVEEAQEGELGGGVALEATAAVAAVLPEKIEAEDFVDFEDTTSQHFGNCRSGPVDMQTISGANCYVG